MSTIQPIIFRVNQSILGRQSGQASHIVLSCAGNFDSSILSTEIPLIFPLDVQRRNGQKRGTCLLVFQLAAYPPFPASDMGWGKELGQVQD
ncbi:hypothetical protein L3X38_040896 [Prunus dulcis]|uniref:Uncharacterized protein n=1 Tax=Prunus dulcis TaxID=3755 RepID=A0AAD4YKE2_PRUDU|nr:hypothetical protein L3X38_040896 [Prunus dulcis]